MQETRFELWIPVHHTTQLQHWTAATDALDHVILTTAALESVLEGILSGADCRQTGLHLQYNDVPPKHSRYKS